MKACPFCAEQIQDAAILCRFCNRSLPAAATGTITCPVCGVVSPNTTSQCVCGLKFIEDARKAAASAKAPASTAAPTPQPATTGKRSSRLLIYGLIALAVIVIVATNTKQEDGARPAAATTSTRPAPLATPPRAAPPAEAPKPPLTLLSTRGYDERDYAYVEGQVKNDSAESLENVAVHVTWFTTDGTFVKTDDALIDFNPILPGQTSSFKSMTRNNPEMAKFRVEFKRLMGGSIEHTDARKK